MVASSCSTVEVSKSCRMSTSHQGRGEGGAGAGWTATAVVAVLVFWLPERAASTAAAMEPSSCFTTELMTACSLETWDTWAVTSGVGAATGLNKI